MKKFAESFYKSTAWQNCRESYVKSKGGLCEKCLEEGRITPGEIVHHKIPVTEETINNPDVLLSHDNLVLLCRFHHAEAHNKHPRRYYVDDMGRVIARY